MLATNQTTTESILQPTVVTTGQPIGDCSIRVYRSR